MSGVEERGDEPLGVVGGDHRHGGGLLVGGRRPAGTSDHGGLPGVKNVSTTPSVAQGGTAATASAYAATSSSRMPAASEPSSGTVTGRRDRSDASGSRWSPTHSKPASTVTGCRLRAMVVRAAASTTTPAATTASTHRPLASPTTTAVTSPAATTRPQCAPVADTRPR